MNTEAGATHKSISLLGSIADKLFQTVSAKNYGRPVILGEATQQQLLVLLSPTAEGSQI